MSRGEKHMEKMERRKMLERGKREDKRSWGGEEAVPSLGHGYLGICHGSIGL